MLSTQQTCISYTQGPKTGLDNIKCYKNIINVHANTGWESTVHSNNKPFNFYH